MHGFLKKILGRKEPKTVSLTYAGIVAWLQEREDQARETLESETRPSKTVIRQTMDELREIVDGIRRAERDPAVHPKLRSIAKNSLPLYTRAMHTLLARELPEGSEEFYTAAAECLKGCLNSTHGQGRYLQAVFPEEMKAIRQKIDVIGREVNRITTFLAEFRGEKDRIDAAGSVYRALEETEADLRKAADKEGRIASRVQEMTGRQTAIENELMAISTDPRLSEVASLESLLKAEEAERDLAARTYAALSMTASHVLRKAEKIAARQKHPAEIAILRRVTELLADHEIPDPDTLQNSLAAAFPIAARMIDAGEITLKNKEERAVFSGPGAAGGDISAACSSLRQKEDAVHALQESLISHPILQKKNSLEREKAQLVTMILKEESARKELGEWRDRTVGKIPGLKEELQKKMGIILGEGVQMQIHDRQQV